MNGPALPPAVPASVLRVYEPLEAFPVGDRSALQALALRPDANLRAEHAERNASWRGLLRRGAPVAARQDTTGRQPAAGPARVLHRGGILLVCPVAAAPPAGGVDGTWPAGDQQPRPPGRHRAGDVGPWHTPSAFDAGFVPAAGPGDDWAVDWTALPASPPLQALAWASSDALAPDPAAAAGPHRTLTRAWQLPVPWLALARREDDDGAGRYLVAMSTARSRSARALRTLRAGLGELDLTLDAEVLARWLESFHPRSCVELDVSALRPLVGPDDGVDDVRLGLECLACADMTGTAASYHRLSSRSRLLGEIARSS